MFESWSGVSRSLHLWDDLIAAALNAEAIDVIAAEQRRQVLTCPAQINALGTELVSIEYHLGLGLIEFQVRVSEHEEAAGEGFHHQLVGDVIQLLRFRG